MFSQPSISVKKMAYVPSSYARFTIPGVQKVGSGSAIDVSGYGRNAVFDAGVADNASGPWSKDGWFNPQGNSKGLTIPGVGAANSACPFNLAAGDSLYFAFQFLAANPGFGFGFTGNLTLSPGFKYGCNASGLGNFSVSDGTNTFTSSDLATVCDSKPHIIEVWLNGRDKTARTWVDFTEQTLTNASLAAVTGSTISTFIPGWGFGHSGNVSVSGSMACQFRAVQNILLPLAGLPSDANLALGRLRTWYKGQPMRALPLLTFGV